MGDLVRRAGAGDLPALLSLYRFLLPEGAPPPPPPPPEIWTHLLAHPDFFAYFLAEKGGEPVATANVTVIPNLTHGGRPFAIVENVVSHPEVRGQGYGRAVMLAIEDFARSRNCYKIQLQSGSPRLKAHAFYESLGYSRTAKVGFTLALE
jgi:GNAT superfamily N-acetyltransferase